MITMPFFMHAKFKADVTACLSNERVIAESLEIRKNTVGSYPERLETLEEEGRLRENVVCPSNCKTYFNKYEINDERDRFTVSCPGIHYKLLDWMKEDYPQFSSATGLDIGDNKD